MLPRKQYMNKLIQKRENGRIKIITDLRQSGKSLLLFQLYHDYLIREGIKESQIISLVSDWHN